MGISIEEVRHIANLSRIKLTEQEEVVYTNQLGSILAFVNSLNQVDTEEVPATSQVTGLVNSYRDDEVAEVSDEERIQTLRCCAELTESGGVKVKQVFED